MNDYFVGAIEQLKARCEYLVGLIPVRLPREYLLLEQVARREVVEISGKLQQLLDSQVWLDPRNQEKRLRRFKTLVQDVNILETACIAALERKHDNDLFLNKLVEIVRQEIAYPLPPPVITSLAKPKSYFETWTKFGLMLVPLGESNFLLHLPDIYHELAHPLLEEKHDPKIKAFQSALLDVINEVAVFIEDEIEKSERRGEAHILRLRWDAWARCWIYWAKEFFCDLFAVYVLGPAFAWSHLHLSATRGADAFQVPLFGEVTTHPPDAARMEAILNGLTLIDFASEAAVIEARWKQYLATAQEKPTAEYQKCLPHRLLKTVAEKALEGVKAINCRIAASDTKDAIHDLFNEAWREFWRAPDTYVRWEAEKVKLLKQTYLA